MGPLLSSLRMGKGVFPSNQQAYISEGEFVRSSTKDRTWHVAPEHPGAKCLSFCPWEAFPGWKRTRIPADGAPGPVSSSHCSAFNMPQL